jgi:ABC-type lipoprotein release transport system permease subunit
MSGLGLGAQIALALLIALVVLMLLFGIRKSYILRMAVKSLKRHKKMNMALLSATCISTTVIVGSLIAGDSLSASITDAVFDNLGEVDEVVISNRLFDTAIIDRLNDDSTLMESVDLLSPIIHMQGIAENSQTKARTRTATIIGFEPGFFDFGEMVYTDGNQVNPDLDENEVYINEELASEIGVKQGDMIGVSFTDLDSVFEAIFHGNRKQTTTDAMFLVKGLVRSHSLGRFQLTANRNPPQNLFIELDNLNGVMGIENKANMILVSNKGDKVEGLEICSIATQKLENALEDALIYSDAGLNVIENQNLNYVKVEADDIFFPHGYYELLENSDVLAGNAISPHLTYFWNTLTLGNNTVAYSTVTSFDSDIDSEFGQFTLNGSGQKVDGDLQENEIIITNWTAERLQANPGDTVYMNYSIMDEFYNIHYYQETFTIKYIVDMQGKANDSALMPPFPGIEDRTSPFDWDPPFPLELGLITDEDEHYWESYKGTPKAFISMKSGAKMWDTDIGNITHIKLKPQAGQNLSQLADETKEVLSNYVGLSEAQLAVKAVKQDALNSREGITIFTGMFLAFSAACIMASAVLIILLITLMVESRQPEIGILRALGFRMSAVNNIFLLEGTFLSILGGLLGALFGFLFGLFLISGMNTFWSAIVESSQVSFSFTPDSLILGFSSGVIISIFTMIFAFKYEGRRTIVGSIKKITQKKENKLPFLMSLLFLLGGVASLGLPFIMGSSPGFDIELISFGLGPFLLLLAVNGFVPIFTKKRIDLVIGIIIIVHTLFIMYYFADSAMLMALFFLSGFQLLFGFLLIFYHSIMKMTVLAQDDILKRPARESKRWLFSFAKKNAARTPKRTMFTVFLFSLTLFVLVSLTINLQGAVIDVDRAVSESGGGFHIMGESTNPVFANLANQSSREEAGVEDPVFDELFVQQFKSRGDIGGTCSNLNPKANPRIIGANESFFDINSFLFISNTEPKTNVNNPWWLLKEVLEDNEIPAVGDYNTLVWILGLDVGDTITIFNEDGEEVNLRIVGIIANSIFPGSLVIWDEYFDLLYPTNDGYQLFLFRSQAKDLKPQIQALENVLTKYGFDGFTVESVVVENILIENTYIAIFQVLLIFGLIIGTLGFGIVASRNALERRREMGILRAIGFTKKAILKTLLYENSYIVIVGITIGTLSGIIASSVYLIKLQVDLISWPWLNVLMILAASFVIAISASIIPIIKSSKMSVTEAIGVYE